MLRGCPKAYHPSCVNRDEAFFRTKGQWNCGKLWLEHLVSFCWNYYCRIGLKKGFFVSLSGVHGHLHGDSLCFATICQEK